MICHERRFLFVHIPKTAGSSLGEALGCEWQNHKDIRRYRRELPSEQFLTYFKFAIVRNPWERLLSDYNFQIQKSSRSADRLHVFDERGRQRPFGEWVRLVLGGPVAGDARCWGGSISPTIHRWSPQYDWISIDGENVMDYVGRVETLDVDMDVICDRIGIPRVKLPSKKRRFHLHYSHYYDEASRDLVASYYAKDIAEFGYTFEQARPLAPWQRKLLGWFHPSLRQG